jgi:hypothetical protein
MIRMFRMHLVKGINFVLCLVSFKIFTVRDDMLIWGMCNVCYSSANLLIESFI